MHRKGRTWDSCYADWHEERLKEQRYNAQSAQETAEAAAASAQAQSANAASSSQANREGDDEDRLTAAQEAEVRAAIADYKQRFIAKHGQAVRRTVLRTGARGSCATGTRLSLQEVLWTSKYTPKALFNFQKIPETRACSFF